MSPKELLAQGRGILDPFMTENGFIFKVIDSGKGSGGEYVSCQYVKNDRVIEFHVRFNLGLVSYSIGHAQLMHEDYMRLKKINNKYPGFSENPVDSFRALFSDLENFCVDFIRGDGKEFLRLVQEFKKNPNQFKGLP